MRRKITGKTILKTFNPLLHGGGRFEQRFTF